MPPDHNAQVEAYNADVDRHNAAADAANARAALNHELVATLERMRRRMWLTLWVCGAVIALNVITITLNLTRSCP